MGPIAPPPLPDHRAICATTLPPALPCAGPGDAGVAPALSYAAGATHAPRRAVGGGTRFWLYLPLPVMLVCVGLLLMKQWSSGADFRHDSTHAAIRIFDLCLFGGIAAVPLVVGAIVLACTWRRLEPRSRRLMAAACAAALLAGLASIPASEAAFQSSKTRAYGRVNPALLTADCAAAAATLGPNTYRGSDPALPAYLRSLGAKWVQVSPAGVKVIMSTDLFAGVFEEGLVVPLAPLPVSPQVHAAQNRLTVISATPPVFRYSSR